MSKYAVVYWSGTGNTEKMALAVQEGIQQAGAEVDVFQASQFCAEKMDVYAGAAFGCPSMGVEQLESDEFEPMFQSVEPKLKGKRVALFGSYDWGDGEWMRTWQESVEQLGCVLVADGLIANNEPDDEALASCRALGETLVQRA